MTAYVITDIQDPSESVTIHAVAPNRTAAGEKLVELLRPLMEGSDFFFIDNEGREEPLESVLASYGKDLDGFLYFEVHEVPSSSD